jgi:3-oxoacyl-[acyl-carrier-protein] synthase II
MPRVVITGLGLVCALGPTLRDAWPRLVRGDHGIAPIRRFDASGYPARLAAEVGEVDTAFVAGLPDGPENPMRRGTALFVAAAREAWADAGLGANARDAAAGVAAGASVNYLHMAHIRRLWHERDQERERVDLTRVDAERMLPASSFDRRHGEFMSAIAGTALGISGPRYAIDTACASGSHAIVDAFRAVARGEVPTMVAGAGSGLIVPITVLAFARIGALTPSTDPLRASRPFDRRRDGFVLGEGAAVVVLEDEDRARARGARIYAEVLGAASTINGQSLTDPSPMGEVEARTITLALDDAQVDSSRVDYVAAHGTSTPKNDVTETQAIRRALGAAASRAAVSSNKAQIGHTLPAAGAVNVVVAAMAIAEQMLPPTAHLTEADPLCDLDYVPGHGRPAPVDVALAHAFAFGGQNVVIVLGGAREGSQAAVLDASTEAA